MKTHGPVKMYGLTTCFHCKSVVTFLDEMGVSFELINIDTMVGDERKEILKEVKLINERCSFPTTVIGERVVVGYKQYELREALGI